jgi:hypothetical protein
MYELSLAVLLETHTPHIYVSSFLLEEIFVLISLACIVFKSSSCVLAMSELVGEGGNLFGEN